MSALQRGIIPLLLSESLAHALIILHIQLQFSHAAEDALLALQRAGSRSLLKDQVSMVTPA